MPVPWAPRISVSSTLAPKIWALRVLADPKTIVEYLHDRGYLRLFWECGGRLRQAAGRRRLLSPDPPMPLEGRPPPVARSPAFHHAPSCFVV